jgi:hydroxypyruvate isomerase
MKYSACIEWLFAETGGFPERIRAAKQAGLDGVEFWKWTTKDIGPIAEALEETGLKLTGFVAEPMVPLTDPGRHAEFLEGLKASIDMARRLKAPVLIAQTGDDLAGRTRAEQRAALSSCLARAAAPRSGSSTTSTIPP